MPWEFRYARELVDMVEHGLDIFFTALYSRDPLNLGAGVT
jgi:hypothetical protein